MTEPTKPKILNVQEVFAKKLAIPDYQRPYKWQTKHIKQLVDDILSYFDMDKKAECRLGTVVLHHEKAEQDDQENIVDGQQRLVSLFLLLYCLHDKNAGFDKHGFLNQKFNHSQSVERIKENYDFIKAYLDNLDMDKSAFKKYILNHCTFAVVVLDKIDEAFQYFDSQNSRGKSLEAYDLLKAYHLREMADGEGKRKLVEVWEKNAAAESGTPKNPVWLKLIISDVLYRHRQWENGNKAEIFTGNHVDVFKGLNKKDQAKYPKLLARYDNHEKQMNGVIVDGKWFFDYVGHYKELYEALFGDNGKLADIRIDGVDKPLFLHLKNHANVNTGDYFIFTAFTVMLMRYYDKFGDAELKNVVIKIARWVYFLRFNYKRIDFSTVENYLWETDGLYVALQKAITPEQIVRFDIGRIEKRNDSKNTAYLNELLHGFYDDKTQTNNGATS